MDKGDVIYTEEYYLTIKKVIMPFVTKWMGLEIITLNEVGQRKTNIDIYHLFVELKKWYKWTSLQSRNWLTDIENKFTVTKEGRKIK